MGRTVAQSSSPETRIPTSRCALEGCNEFTRERKPYCSDHILEIDYAKALSIKVSGVEKEIERVSTVGDKAVDVTGLVVEEILAGIDHAGQVTWRRLCKDHVAFFNHVSAEITDHYLDRLRLEGLVKVTLNRRSDEVVELTSRGLRKARRGI